MGADVCVAHGRREQEALAERATELAERGELFVAFDAFGDRAEAELVTESHDRAGEAWLVGRAEQFDERPVDLQAVDGEAMEVAERRVAGAEVVERE